jgi:hypothetical protein
MNNKNMRKLSLALLMGVLPAAVNGAAIAADQPINGMQHLTDLTKQVLHVVQANSGKLDTLLGASKVPVTVEVQKGAFVIIGEKVGAWKTTALTQAQAAFQSVKNGVSAVPGIAKKAASSTVDAVTNCAKTVGNGIAKAGGSAKEAFVGAVQKTAGGIQYVFVNAEEKLISVYDATLLKCFDAGLSLNKVNGHVKAAVVVTTAAVVIGGTVWLVKNYIARKQAAVEHALLERAPTIVKYKTVVNETTNEIVRYEIVAESEIN